MSDPFVHYNSYLSGQSMASSFNGDAVKLKAHKNYSLQIVWTGSAFGKFKLQCSNDADVNNVSNWSDVKDSVVNISASGDIMYNVENCNYLMFRLVYTATSGTGTASAKIVLKA